MSLFGARCCVGCFVALVALTVLASTESTRTAAVVEASGTLVHGIPFDPVGSGHPTEAAVQSGNLSLKLKLAAHRFLNSVLTDEALFDSFVESLLRDAPAAIRRLSRSWLPRHSATLSEDRTELSLVTAPIDPSVPLGGCKIPLRVTRRVLDCSCPHTLRVSPTIEIDSDEKLLSILSTAHLSFDAPSCIPTNETGLRSYSISLNGVNIPLLIVDWHVELPGGVVPRILHESISRVVFEAPSFEGELRITAGITRGRSQARMNRTVIRRRQIANADIEPIKEEHIVFGFQHVDLAALGKGVPTAAVKWRVHPPTHLVEIIPYDGREAVACNPRDNYVEAALVAEAVDPWNVCPPVVVRAVKLHFVSAQVREYRQHITLCASTSVIRALPLPSQVERLVRGMWNCRNGEESEQVTSFSDPVLYVSSNANATLRSCSWTLSRHTNTVINGVQYHGTESSVGIEFVLPKRVPIKGTALSCKFSTTTKAFVVQLHSPTSEGAWLLPPELPIQSGRIEDTLLYVTAAPHRETYNFFWRAVSPPCDDELMPCSLDVEVAPPISANGGGPYVTDAACIELNANPPQPDEVGSWSVAPTISNPLLLFSDVHDPRATLCGLERNTTITLVWITSNEAGQASSNVSVSRCISVSDDVWNASLEYAMLQPRVFCQSHVELSVPLLSSPFQASWEAQPPTHLLKRTTSDGVSLFEVDLPDGTSNVWFVVRNVQPAAWHPTNAPQCAPRRVQVALRSICLEKLIPTRAVLCGDEALVAKLPTIPDLAVSVHCNSSCAARVENNVIVVEPLVDARSCTCEVTHAAAGVQCKTKVDVFKPAIAVHPVIAPLIVFGEIATITCTDKETGVPFNGVWDLKSYAVRDDYRKLKFDQDIEGMAERSKATLQQQDLSSAVLKCTPFDGEATVIFHTTQNGTECLPERIEATIHIVHAQVLHKDSVVCGSTYFLEALPLSQSVVASLEGRWVLLNNTLADITIENPHQATTSVEGLDFGVWVFEWRVESSASGEIMDRATTSLTVITHNVRRRHLVAPSADALIPITPSMRSWTLHSAPPHSRVTMWVDEANGQLHVAGMTEVGKTTLQFTYVTFNVSGNKGATTCVTHRQQDYIYIHRVSAISEPSVVADTAPNETLLDVSECMLRRGTLVITIETKIVNSSDDHCPVPILQDAVTVEASLRNANAGLWWANQNFTWSDFHIIGNATMQFRLVMRRGSLPLLGAFFLGLVIPFGAFQNVVGSDEALAVQRNDATMHRLAPHHVFASTSEVRLSSVGLTVELRLQSEGGFRILGNNFDFGSLSSRVFSTLAPSVTCTLSQSGTLDVTIPPLADYSISHTETYVASLSINGVCGTPPAEDDDRIEFAQIVVEDVPARIVNATDVLKLCDIENRPTVDLLLQGGSFVRGLVVTSNPTVEHRIALKMDDVGVALLPDTVRNSIQSCLVNMMHGAVVHVITAKHIKLDFSRCHGLQLVDMSVFDNEFSPPVTHHPTIHVELVSGIVEGTLQLPNQQHSISIVPSLARIALIRPHNINLSSNQVCFHELGATGLTAHVALFGDEFLPGVGEQVRESTIESTNLVVASAFFEESENAQRDDAVDGTAEHPLATYVEAASDSALVRRLNSTAVEITLKAVAVPSVLRSVGRLRYAVPGIATGCSGCMLSENTIDVLPDHFVSVQALVDGQQALLDWNGAASISAFPGALSVHPPCLAFHRDEWLGAVVYLATPSHQKLACFGGRVLQPATTVLPLVEKISRTVGAKTIEIIIVRSTVEFVNASAMCQALLNLPAAPNSDEFITLAHRLAIVAELQSWRHTFFVAALFVHAAGTSYLAHCVVTQMANVEGVHAKLIASLVALLAWSSFSAANLLLVAGWYVLWLGLWGLFILRHPTFLTFEYALLHIALWAFLIQY